MNKNSNIEKEIIKEARYLSKKLNHGYIGTEHLLYAISRINGGAKEILNKFGIDYKSIEEEISDIIGFGSVKVFNTPLTKASNEVLASAYDVLELNKDKQKSLDTIHILSGITNNADSLAVYILEFLLEDDGYYLKDLIKEVRNSIKNLVTTENVNYYASNSFTESLSNEKYQIEDEELLKLTGNNINKNLKIPNLEKYGINMNIKAEKGNYDPLIGREKELNRIIEILGRRNKNNPILAGVGGCGKSALVEGLAQKIVNKDVPINLLDKQIYLIEMANLVAGSKYRGDFEQRIKDIIKEASDNKEIILFIDEIHTIVGAGAADSNSMDGANILKPALSRGQIQCIGATTFDEYRKTIEKDGALNRRFQLVKVEEPTQEETLEILKGLKEKYENYHGVILTDELLKESIQLSVRYITDRYLPDKAIDLIDEACSKVKTRLLERPIFIKEYNDKLLSITEELNNAVINQEYEKASLLEKQHSEIVKELNEKFKNWKEDKNSIKAKVNINDIAKVLSTSTGVPVDKIGETENNRLINLDKILKEEVKGQDEAVDVISRAIKRNRIGLGDPNKPIGSFLFAGSTGTGKTYLAKKLAKNLFGSENDIIRIDMSEFSEKHTVSRLTGSTAGYVGYEDGGQLTEAVKRKPYSVVLFDEIEKAHPDVFNIFLQILDDGRLTDGQGNVINFKNTVIIMTSNVGSVNIINKTRTIGFGQNTEIAEQKQNKEIFEKAIKEKFRPEFINRIDEIVLFNKLNKTNLEGIIKLLLGEVSNRINKNGINITFDNKIVKHILAKNTENEYGARPFKRLITKEVEDALSDEILLGNVKKGTNIEAKIKNKKIVFVER